MQIIVPIKAWQILFWIIILYFWNKTQYLWTMFSQGNYNFSYRMFCHIYLIVFLTRLFYFICMLIFPSAVWQCNVVCLADADSQTKRIFPFGWKEVGQGGGVNPLQTHECCTNVWHFCAVAWKRLSGSGDFWGTCCGGFGADTMCAYPPLSATQDCLFALCTRVWNWFLCCDYIFKKVDDEPGTLSYIGGL